MLCCIVLYCCVFRFVNFFFLLSTSSSVVWNVFLPEIRLILSYMQNLWLARSRSLIFWPHWHNLFVWIILRAFSDYFSILFFFYWCSLNFGRVYIKPWKKRILCVNLWWFWCCERSNALKKINRRSEFITHHKNQRISWKRQIKLANKCKIIWSWWMSSRFLHKNEFTVSVVSIGAI